MAVKVLPEPVAIWIKAFGLNSLNELSSFVIGFIWQSLKPSVCKTGMSNKLARSDFFSSLQPSPECFWSVKSKTGLDTWLWVSEVCCWILIVLHHQCFHWLFYTKGNGSLFRYFSLLLASKYYSICSSTVLSVQTVFSFAGVLANFFYFALFRFQLLQLAFYQWIKRNRLLFLFRPVSVK